MKNQKFCCKLLLIVMKNTTNGKGFKKLWSTKEKNREKLSYFKELAINLRFWFCEKKNRFEETIEEKQWFYWCVCHFEYHLCHSKKPFGLKLRVNAFLIYVKLYPFKAGVQHTRLSCECSIQCTLIRVPNLIPISKSVAAVR